VPMIHCHLIVARSGKVRVTKGGGTLDADEIAIGVTLDLPRQLFDRPILTAKIVVPEDAIGGPDLAAVVSVTARRVAAALKVDVVDVRDGLQLAIDRANADS
jgi:hypothetical protein